MPRCLCIASWLCTALIITAPVAAQNQDQPKLVKINDSIFMAPVSGNV